VEFPHLQNIYEDLKDDGFAVVALEARGDRAGALKFMREKEITFLNFFDPNGEIGGNLYGVYAYPMTFLVDREGAIRYRHIGFREGMEEDFRTEIARLLG
jgi:hypothetical protein